MPVEVGNCKKHQFKLMNNCAIRCDDCNSYTTAVYKRGLPDILICFNCRKVYELMAGELVQEEKPNGISNR
jgi:hypothetical protein